MFVNVQLVIIQLDFKTSEHKVCLDDSKIITQSLENTDIASALREMICKFLIIKSDWVTFNLIDVTTDKNVINIIYACIVPNVIKCKTGKWYKLGEINDPLVQKIVCKASQYA